MSVTTDEVKALVTSELRAWRLDTNYGRKPMNMDKWIEFRRLCANVGVTGLDALAAIKGARLEGIE